MRWLETITLRCTESDQYEEALELLKQVNEEERDHSIISLHCFRNAEVESDLSVHLLWNSNGSSPDKSPLGSRLVHLLRDLGFVHHAIWIEETAAGQRSARMNGKSE